MLLVLTTCLCAQQTFAYQATRSYNATEPYRQNTQPYRQWQQPYGGVQIQNYVQSQPYVQPYYPYYSQYEPDNGPMRGPNSIEGHQYHSYRQY